MRPCGRTVPRPRCPFRISGRRPPSTAGGLTARRPCGCPGPLGSPFLACDLAEFVIIIFLWSVGPPQPTTASAAARRRGNGRNGGRYHADKLPGLLHSAGFIAHPTPLPGLLSSAGTLAQSFINPSQVQSSLTGLEAKLCSVTATRTPSQTVDQTLPP